MRKWYWPVILLLMGTATVATCVLAFLTGGSGAIFMCFIMMIALAILCLVAATIVAFGLAFIEIGTLGYEYRVEFIAGISSLILFIAGLSLELSYGWLLP